MPGPMNSCLALLNLKSLGSQCCSCETFIRLYINNTLIKKRAVGHLLLGKSQNFQYLLPGLNRLHLNRCLQLQPPAASGERGAERTAILYSFLFLVHNWSGVFQSPRICQRSSSQKGWAGSEHMPWLQRHRTPSRLGKRGRGERKKYERQADETI